MSKAIQNNAEALEQYKTDKVVFIIDECHRSQFGDMHRIVRQHFNNAQYFDLQAHHVLKKIEVKMDEALQIYLASVCIRI